VRRGVKCLGMEISSVERAASVFTAIGTVAVAIAAIWGDWIRSKIASPRLELSLVSRSDQTKTGAGLLRIYHHIHVRNTRQWSPAKNVRIVVQSLMRKGADGTFFPEYLILPLQLCWVFPNSHELLPTIGPEDRCDLGWLEQTPPPSAGPKTIEQFKLSTYITPNNFRGFVRANESIRVIVIALSENAESKPLLVEISWDGVWSPDREEMERHLVVKQVLR